MAGLPVRDALGDHLLTPRNAALAAIDYQPVAVSYPFASFEERR